MALNRKQIIYGGLVIVAVCILALIVASTVSKNRTYARLETAAMSQPFAQKLGDATRTATECYPEGKSSKCLAIRYRVSAEDCQTIATGLGVGNEQDTCDYAKDVQRFEGHDITYTTGKWQGKYAVSVSWE